MVDDVEEGLKTNATLTNVSVEEPDADDDIGKLAELSDLLWRSQGYEWSKTSSWQDRLESSRHLPFNGVRNGGIKLDRGVISNNVLLILIQQVVEDLLVEKRDALEVIARPWLKADNLIDEPV